MNYQLFWEAQKKKCDVYWVVEVEITLNMNFKQIF